MAEAETDMKCMLVSWQFGSVHGTLTVIFAQSSAIFDTKF